MCIEASRILPLLAVFEGLSNPRRASCAEDAYSQTNSKAAADNTDIEAPQRPADDQTGAAIVILVNGIALIII